MGRLAGSSMEVAKLTGAHAAAPGSRLREREIMRKIIYFSLASNSVPSWAEGPAGRSGRGHALRRSR
jgi:hypothetical protein